MRSRDFIKEAGRNGSSEFDVAPNAKRAETPDWLKKAGSWIQKNVLGGEPVPLPDYTASNQEAAAKESNYRGIDPVIRQSLGMAPATQQEIDAYVKANPAVVGGLTGRDGKPIVSGGAQELERAARAAAPSRRADFDVDSEIGAPDPAAVGDRFYTPRKLGFHPGGTMPAAPVAAATPAAPVAAATPAAPAAAPAAAAVAAEPAAAAAELPSGLGSNRFNRRDQTVAGAAPAAEPVTRELERLTRLAGVKDPTAPAEEPPVAVKDRLAAVDSGSLGRPANAGVAAAAPASGGGDPTQDLFIRDKSDDKFNPVKKIVKPTPNPTPVPKPVGPSDWTTVKIQRASERQGYGPEGQPLYILGAGTPNQTFAYYRQENKTLVPMDMNNGRADLKQYQPIPWDVASKWGSTVAPPGQSATPTPTSGNPVYDRFKTTDAVDAEIKRFINKGSDMRLPANQEYINNLNARKAELSGAGTATTQNAEPAASKSVVVNRNDTLSKIAAANGTTVQRIMAMNPNIKDPNKIAVGQTLKIRESSDIGRMRLLAGLAKD